MTTHANRTILILQRQSLQTLIFGLMVIAFILGRLL
jgi:hypothetical protein